MRILMLDNEFPPIGGGQGTANLAVLKHYSRFAELEIDLITAARGIHFESEQFSERIRIIKVPVWNTNLHHSTNRELMTYTALALPVALKWHRRRRYDFCFAWSTVPAGAVALTLKYLTGLSYMLWVTGPDIPGFEQRYRMLYPVLTPLITRVWRSARPVIVKCNEELQMMQGVDPTVSASLVPNGVDLSAFQPGPPIPDDGPLKIICVARLIERKGQRQLIEAIRRLADDGVNAEVTFVGTGDALGDYAMLAKRLGVVNLVHFEGYVPREVVPQYYAAAHVCVLPSFNEGMSIAVLEGMAAGLPVIMTRSGGVKELVAEGVNGLTFEWGDVDMLCAHLRRIATDRNLARSMGRMSRERSLHYSWERIADQFYALFPVSDMGSPAVRR